MCVCVCVSTLTLSLSPCVLCFSLYLSLSCFLGLCLFISYRIFMTINGTIYINHITVLTFYFTSFHKKNLCIDRTCDFFNVMSSCLLILDLFTRHAVHVLKPRKIIWYCWSKSKVGLAPLCLLQAADLLHTTGYAWVCVSTRERETQSKVCLCVPVCVCLCVCMCACVHVCMYMCIRQSAIYGETLQI